MRMRIHSLPLFLIVLSLLSLGYFAGIASVPFHPDESSYLYMSSDLETFFHSPAAFFWRPENSGAIRQQYRLLNPPLVHTLTGLGRWTAGLPAPRVDWDWTKTWHENQQAGGLPSANLLFAGRMAEAVLYPFSILFLFLAARRVSNDFTAWMAALLLATNALVLLHTRRAMAEGALLFTLTLSMWILVKAEKRPWLVAVPAALAFCAKQSLAALGPVGLLAVLWPVSVQKGASGKKRILQFSGQAALYAVTFVAIVVLLNPFLWRHPIPAVQAALRARQDLASAQTGDRPDQVLSTVDRKLIGLIGSVYLTPPIFAETSNYLADTRAAEEAYLSNPLHSLFRSIPAGGLLLVLNLFGFSVGVIRAARPGHPAQRGLALLLTATLVQTLVLLVLIPLPWQRYYLPVVPYTCLWTAFGIDQILEPIRNKLAHKSQIQARVVNPK